jgi:hypothetical protein
LVETNTPKMVVLVVESKTGESIIVKINELSTQLYTNPSGTQVTYNQASTRGVGRIEKKQE